MLADRPDGRDLLTQEASVRRDGSRLNSHDLVGRWRLRQLWGKGQTTPSNLASMGLRAVQATLELDDGAEGLGIVNSVLVGPINLRFTGTAELVGRRPLLRFSFKTVELRWGARIMWRRSLPTLMPRRMPFFALIARDPSGWLAARGRGGGLALWDLVENLS